MAYFVSSPLHSALIVIGRSCRISLGTIDKFDGTIDSNRSRRTIAKYAVSLSYEVNIQAIARQQLEFQLLNMLDDRPSPHKQNHEEFGYSLEKLRIQAIRT